MRKLIAAAIAATALGAGTAATAQDLGAILGGIFGYGSGTPAVVAGTGSTIYQDNYGRRFYYDQYGRQVYLQDQQQQQIVGYDQWGRPVYGQEQQIVGYDNYGRPIYGTPRAYVYGGQYPQYSSNDRDGDGVPNWRDRWPDDRRYW